MEVKKGLNDKNVLIAGVIGAFSTIASEIISWILRYLGFGSQSIYQLNSLLVTGDKPSILIGLVFNFIVGFILGAIVYVTLKKWGHKYTISISTTATLIIWIIWEIVFTLDFEGKLIPMRPMGAYYNHLIASFAYGVFMGLMLKRFIFNKV